LADCRIVDNSAIAAVQYSAQGFLLVVNNNHVDHVCGTRCHRLCDKTLAIDSLSDN